MKRFVERDVRRFYDLLQHKSDSDSEKKESDEVEDDPSSGLTQLNVIDDGHLIGVGLFDNEDDFVSECERYNTLGVLRVGINPRSKRLLEEYGGLHNRIRSLFTDVVDRHEIASVTGLMVSEPGQLTRQALDFKKDVSVMGDGSWFFPFDEAILLEDMRPRRLAKQIAEWFFGEATLTKVELDQMVPVPGTQDPEGTLFHPRIRFRKFRPYILEGIAKAIRGEEDA